MSELKRHSVPLLVLIAGWLHKVTLLLLFLALTETAFGQWRPPGDDKPPFHHQSSTSTPSIPQSTGASVSRSPSLSGQAQPARSELRGPLEIVNPIETVGDLRRELDQLEVESTNVD